MTQSLKLPALQPESAEARQETDYPGEYKNIVAGRARRALGDALGLSQFGVNSVHLAPRGASAQRHWHSKEDEFVVILQGEVVLISDGGEQILRAGGPGLPTGTTLLTKAAKRLFILRLAAA